MTRRGKRAFGSVDWAFQPTVKPPHCKPEYKDLFIVDTCFVSNNVRREWIAEGHGRQPPVPRRGTVVVPRRHGSVDVALLNCSRPNDEAICKLRRFRPTLPHRNMQMRETIIAQIKPEHAVQPRRPWLCMYPNWPQRSKSMTRWWKYQPRNRRPTTSPSVVMPLPN